MGINGKINEIHGQNLVVFVNDILMLVQFDVFIFIVEID